MTQPKPATIITKETLEYLKGNLGRVEDAGINTMPVFTSTLSALIALAEPIAAGTHALVPIEPTDAMQSVGLTMWANSPDDDDFICTHIYRAMIAASTGNEKTAPK